MDENIHIPVINIHIPAEHLPPPWVAEEGYQLHDYRVPLKGEEVWSPHLQHIVRANGEETHNRVVLVFVGQTAPPWPKLDSEPECDHDHCDHCGAPLEDEPSPELANVLPFPREAWRP